MLADLQAVFRDLYRYQWIYLLRSLFLQVLVGSLGTYLLSEFFYLVLLLGNQDQLRLNNLGQLLTHPLAVLGLLFYFFLLVILIYSEFAILIDMLQRKDRQFNWSWSGLKGRLKAMWHAVSGWQLIPFLGYVLLTIPVMQWVLSSTLLDRFHIPYFIKDELLKQPGTATVWVLAGVAVHYLNLRLIYTMPLTVLRTHTRFWDNVVGSWRLTRGKTVRLLQGLSLLFLPLVAVGLVILLGLLSLLYALDFGLVSKGIQWIAMTFIWGLSFSLTMVSKVIMVSYLLRQLKADQSPVAYEDLPKVSRKKRLLALGAIFVLGLGQFLVNYERLSYNPYNASVQTIAHRGDVTKGVENSLESLEGAAEAGVDYVEMDVMLSQDRQLIVSHDDNLRRLSGENRSISTSAARDVVGLPIHQGQFSSQLVSFETYVNRAKELETKLMVELKPHGQEPDDYAQLVVNTLRDLGVSRDYKLMSLDLKLMEEIEELAPEIQTGYVIPFQFGSLPGEELDFFLIEDFSYRERLVWEAQWRGQDLYVWTINREEQMSRYLNSPVAGLITDDPGLVGDVKASLREQNTFLDRLMRLLD